MLTNKTKAFLTIFLNLKPSASFFASYVVIWFVWHNDFLLTLITANGDLGMKMGAAVSSVINNQYVLVLFLTITLILIRHGFNYLAEALAEDENNNVGHLLANGSSAASENEMDIKRLMATLESVKNELSLSKENEKKANNDKKDVIRKLMEIEAQLEESMADQLILDKQNRELHAQLNNLQSDALCQS